MLALKLNVVFLLLLTRETYFVFMIYIFNQYILWLKNICFMFVLLMNKLNLLNKFFVVVWNKEIAWFQSIIILFCCFFRGKVFFFWKCFNRFSLFLVGKRVGCVIIFIQSSCRCVLGISWAILCLKINKWKNNTKNYKWN